MHFRKITFTVAALFAATALAVPTPMVKEVVFKGKSFKPSEILAVIQDYYNTAIKDTVEVLRYMDATRNAILPQDKEKADLTYSLTEMIISTANKGISISKAGGLETNDQYVELLMTAANFKQKYSGKVSGMKNLWEGYLTTAKEEGALAKKKEDAARLAKEAEQRLAKEEAELSMKEQMDRLMAEDDEELPDLMKTATFFKKAKNNE